MRAILTYHSIDDSGSVISVPPAVFDRHVRWLASGVVSVVPLAELLHLPDSRHAVALTFDDAYVNFETEAWPRLRTHGLPVTVFVPTRFAGRANEWPATPSGAMPRLPILGWPALGRLQADGVTLGAHTRTHPDLRRLDTTAVADEVWGSIEDLRRETGRRPEAFAYPYGWWALASASVVRTACAFGCTTELRPLRAGDESHLLPRLDAYYLMSAPGALEHFGRWRFGAYLGWRRQLRRAAQRLRR